MKRTSYGNILILVMLYASEECMDVRLDGKNLRHLRILTNSFKTLIEMINTVILILVRASAEIIVQLQPSF